MIRDEEERKLKEEEKCKNEKEEKRKEEERVIELSKKGVKWKGKDIESIKIVYKQPKEDKLSCSSVDLDEYFRTNLFELHEDLGTELPELDAVESVFEEAIKTAKR